MLHPHTIDPRDLLPPGKEFDSEREVVCLCGRTVKLGTTKLTWADLGDGYGYRAVCCQGCLIIHFPQGKC